MSKVRIVQGCVWAAVVAACLIFSATAQAATAGDAQAIASAREAGVKGPYLEDGVFTGRASSYGGPLSVQVTVDNGYITDIQVTKTYDDSPYIDDVMAAKIPQIIALQTYDLDVVTNASYSSHGLLNAVKNALVKAGAVEGEQKTTSTRRRSNTTSALRQLAEEQAAAQKKEWYEMTLGDVLGIEDEADADEAQPTSAGIAGTKLEQDNG